MNCPRITGCHPIKPLFIIEYGVILAAFEPVIELNILKYID
jgi:hypothetical protein